MNWFRHAFAVDSGGPAIPDEAEREVVDTVCREIVRRRLAAPALLVLEMSRPLNYLSAQALHFFQPFVSVLVDTAGYDRFTRFLERRGSIDYLAQRIEALDGSDPASGRPAEDRARS